MPDHPFYWIDAFTQNKLSGNPCAVVLNADVLSARQMQSIAREMNLSETAFVTSSRRADFGARYFTPQEELPFAGHPTIATAHALLQAGLLSSGKELTKLSLEVPAGIIPVEITAAAEEDSSVVTMFQMAPKFLRTYDPQDVLSIYGLKSEDLLPGASIQTVSTGSPVLMIPLASHDALKRVRYVDAAAYGELLESGDFLFPHHFCLLGATAQGRTFARSLGTPPSTLEDPFTGSATGCMAAYLWNHDLITEDRFIAEQGHWMGRPGEATVELVGTRRNIQAVRVAGGAVTLITGTLKA
jgi:trans-2,3-dihydro-3-hydroxyanthranilate isomerase